MAYSTVVVTLSQQTARGKRDSIVRAGQKIEATTERGGGGKKRRNIRLEDTTAAEESRTEMAERAERNVRAGLNIYEFGSNTSHTSASNTNATPSLSHYFILQKMRWCESVACACLHLFLMFRRRNTRTTYTHLFRCACEEEGLGSCTPGGESNTPWPS